MSNRKRPVQRQSTTDPSQKPENKKTDKKKMDIERSNEAWSCQACTFENSKADKRCKTCDTPRSSPTTQKSSNKWTCPDCTLENEPGAVACAVCNAKNPAAILSKKSLTTSDKPVARTTPQKDSTKPSARSFINDSDDDEAAAKKRGTTASKVHSKEKSKPGKSLVNRTDTLAKSGSTNAAGSKPWPTKSKSKKIEDNDMVVEGRVTSLYSLSKLCQ